MGSYPQQMFSQASSLSLSSLFGGGASGTSTNSQWIRSPLMATRRQRGGGKRKNQKTQKKQQTRKQRGGSMPTARQRGGFFSPSVMGPFLKNVEALAAPLSIYLGYKMLKGMRGKKTRRA